MRELPANIAVGQRLPEVLALVSMFFQGTVRGPQLWNALFGDAQVPVRKQGFEGIAYADDFTGY